MVNANALCLGDSEAWYGLCTPRRLTPDGRPVIVDVQTFMRLTALLLTVCLGAAPVSAQQADPSSPAANPSPQADAKSTPDLPVSLDKIRDALERPAAPGQLLRALDNGKQPDFRVEIREKRKLDELIATLDFKSGPTPAGGVYAFEQQRMLFPPVDNPLAQPYAAFSQGQLLTILVENLVGKYLAEKAVSAVTKAVRERAEAEARREVEEAIAEYCASKPDHGAAIQLCTPVVTTSTTTR
jgi:hypothetical protein